MPITKILFSEKSEQYFSDNFSTFSDITNFKDEQELKNCGGVCHHDRYPLTRAHYHLRRNCKLSPSDTNLYTMVTIFKKDTKIQKIQQLYYRTNMLQKIQVAVPVTVNTVCFTHELNTRARYVCSLRHLHNTYYTHHYVAPLEAQLNSIFLAGGNGSFPSTFYSPNLHPKRCVLCMRALPNQVETFYKARYKIQVPDSGGPPQVQPASTDTGAAMDVELRPPPPPTASAAAASAAPFQFLIHEQAKSLVALQELQNEVGALLEFRELVMDTFPHLRNKVSSVSSNTEAATTANEANSSSSANPCSSGVGPPPRWGPGVRVRRKIHPKERGGNSSSGDIEDSSAESSKQTTKSQPKSSECATSGSTVQDSGFSTETKEHHSSVLSPKLATLSTDKTASSMDELWNLLDVIQRKGSRLRDEVEELHSKLQHDAQATGSAVRGVRGGGGEGRAHVDVADEEWSTGPAGVRSWGDDDDEDETPGRDHSIEVQRLRHERDVLLDKVTEMEAETLQSRARVSQLQAELRQVSSMRKDLEEQLHAAVSQKSELNNRIHDLHNQFIRRPSHSISTPNSINEVVSPSKKAFCTSISRSVRGDSSPPCLPSSQVCFGTPSRTSCFQPVVRSCSSPSPRRGVRTNLEGSSARVNGGDSRIPRPVGTPLEPVIRVAAKPLGVLDTVLCDPSQVSTARRPDPRKITAILRERSTLELQRHLLTSVVQNEALQMRLENISRNKGEMAGELERVREENDDLRFQLEEKSIELEGTRARVRVLEKHQLKLPASTLPSVLVENNSGGVSHLGPNPDEPALNSSSTESAHDLASPPLPMPIITDKPPEPPKRHNNRNTATTTIKAKKPSRIPLPPAKSFIPPSKNPSNKNSSSLGRSSLKKNSNESSLSNNSLQNNSKSANKSDSIISKNKDSLHKSRESLSANKSSLPRKTPSLPRPNSSPSTKPNNSTLIKTGTLELDTTKDSLNSASLPMVEVALEPCPVDSLNTGFHRQQTVEESLEELMPWHSSPSEYFDSINSEQQRAEELWQRHSDVTLPRTQAETLVSSVEEAQSSSTSSFPYKPHDSLDPSSVKNVNENCWNSKWNNEGTNKSTTAGLWRVSEHIETILRQISRQNRCDHDN